MEDELIIGCDLGGDDVPCLVVARKQSDGKIDVIGVHYGQEAIDTYNFLSGRFIKSE